MPTEPGLSSDDRRAQRLAVAGAVLAAVLAWGVGEQAHARLAQSVAGVGGIPSPAQVRADIARRQTAIRAESSVALGTLGAALGLAMGVAGGLGRRSAPAARAAGATGLILGGLAGAVMPQAVLPVYFRYYQPDGNELGLAVLTHATMAAVVGGAAGFALGLGLGGRSLGGQTLVGGLMGAGAGVVGFVLIGALGFPTAETTSPVSATAITRLIACAMVTQFTAAGAGIAVTQARLRPGRPGPGTPARVESAETFTPT